MINKRNALKRVIVWITESLLETIVLGALLCTLIVHYLDFAGLWVSALAVGILFMYYSGFLLTTAVFALAFRTDRWWFYPTVAATLFTVHFQYTISSLNSGVNSSTVASVRYRTLPFQLSGVGVIFACTLLGGWLLRKWTRTAVARDHVSQCPAG